MTIEEAETICAKFEEEIAEIAGRLQARQADARKADEEIARARAEYGRTSGPTEREDLVAAERRSDDARREVHAIAAHLKGVRQRHAQAQAELQEAQRVAEAVHAHELAGEHQAVAGKIGEHLTAIIEEFGRYRAIQREGEQFAAAHQPPFQWGDAFGDISLDARAYEEVERDGPGSLWWLLRLMVHESANRTLRSQPPAVFPAPAGITRATGVRPDGTHVALSRVSEHTPGSGPRVMCRVKRAFLITTPAAPDIPNVHTTEGELLTLTLGSAQHLKEHVELVSEEEAEKVAAHAAARREESTRRYSGASPKAPA